MLPILSGSDSSRYRKKRQDFHFHLDWTSEPYSSLELIPCLPVFLTLWAHKLYYSRLKMLPFCFTQNGSVVSDRPVPRPLVNWVRGRVQDITFGGSGGELCVKVEGIVRPSTGWLEGWLNFPSPEFLQWNVKHLLSSVIVLQLEVAPLIINIACMYNKLNASLNRSHSWKDLSGTASLLYWPRHCSRTHTSGLSFSLEYWLLRAPHYNTTQFKN